MQPHDIVRLKNVGETQWTDRFNSQRFVLDPGQEAVVPFGAVCLWLGNPDSRNKVGGPQMRATEYERLRVRYGLAGNSNIDYTSFPKLEAFTFDGDEIVTVAKDPDGKGVHAAESTLDEKEALQNRIDRMSREMESMKKMMEDRDYGALSEELVEDAPTKVPTGPRVSSPE